MKLRQKPSRRFLSLLLTVTMVLTILPFTALPASAEFVLAENTADGTPAASAEPSAQPSESPATSAEPLVEPSESPAVSVEPSVEPSESPATTAEPSAQPSESPAATAEPSAQPSESPAATAEPSAQPGRKPVAARTAVKAVDYSFDDATGTLTVYTNAGTTSWKTDPLFEDKTKATKLIVSPGVTEIKESAFYNKLFASITLPEGLVTIGKEAFSFCPITEITLPDSLTSIGEGAFYSCPLTAVTLPANLESIGKQGFSFQASITFTAMGEVPATIGESSLGVQPKIYVPSAAAISAYKTAWADYKDGVLFAANFNALTANGESEKTTTTELTLTFDKAVSLAAEDITVTGATKGTLTDKGEGLYTLGVSDITVDNAANVTVALSKEGVVFTPASKDVAVYQVADYSFDDATGTLTVNSNSGVTAWSKDSNIDPTKVTSVVVSPGVTEIGEKAFYDTGALASVILPEGLETIGKEAFYYSAFTEITLPESLTSIGASAFYACPLTTVTVPASLTDIGEEAFLTGANTTFTLKGETPATIGTKAFGTPVSTLKIYVPSMATASTYKTAWAAYKSNILYAADFIAVAANGVSTETTTTELTITVDKTVSLAAEDIAVTGITKGALTDKGEGVYTLGVSSIAVANDASVTVTLAKANVEFTPVSKDVVVYKKVLDYSFDDVTGTLTVNSNAGTTAWLEDPLLQDETKVKAVVVNPGVTEIGEMAFYNCQGITTVSLPEGLVSIANEAFAYCPLTEIILPESLTSIGEGAFSATRLATITLPSSLTSIGKDAFKYINSLKKVIVKGETPAVIGEDAFGFTEVGPKLFVPNMAAVSTYQTAWAAYKDSIFYAADFEDLTANGKSEKTTTTELTLTVDKTVDLTLADITITGATKGALTDKGKGVYTLGVTNIAANNSDVTVKLTKSGVAFTPDSKTVKVFKAAKPADKILVPLPALKKAKYTYTGAPIKAEFTAYNTAVIASTETTGTEVGTYETILSLKDTTKYRWDTDKNQDGKWKYTWEIVAANPTPTPTVKPTVAPTEKPVVKPTVKPTVAPTEKPVVKPTVKPTVAPTEKPVVKPTVKPTATPTAKPGPKTGDMRDFTLLFAVAGISLAAITVLVIKRVKTKNR